MLSGNEYRQVGQVTMDHQERTKDGIVNFWNEVTPIFACSCGALVWDKEKHDISHTTTVLGLGL
jgi:hypothetical protein